MTKSCFLMLFMFIMQVFYTTAKVSSEDFGSIPTSELDLLLETYRTGDWQKGLTVSTLSKLDAVPVSLVPFAIEEAIDGNAAAVVNAGKNVEHQNSLSSLLVRIDAHLADRFADLAPPIRGPVVALQEWPSEESLWYLMMQLTYVGAGPDRNFEDEDTVESALKIRHEVETFLTQTERNGALLKYLAAATYLWEAARRDAVDYNELLSKIAVANRLPFYYPFPVPSGSPDEVSSFHSDTTDGTGKLVDLSSRSLYDRFRKGFIDSEPRYFFREHAKMVLRNLLEYAKHDPDVVDTHRREVQIFVYRLLQTDDFSLTSSVNALHSDISRALQRGGFAPFDRNARLSDLVYEIAEGDYPFGTMDSGLLSRLDEISLLAKNEEEMLRLSE